MKTLTVKVTEEDIAKGYRGSCSLCAVARALKRRIRPGGSVFVGSDTITVYYRGFWAWLLGRRGFYITSSPINVQDFVKWFDLRDNASPFTFQITVPREMIPTF